MERYEKRERRSRLAARGAPGVLAKKFRGRTLEPAEMRVHELALCQSRVCGPCVDIPAPLNENRERAAFIHMAIYRDSVVEQGFYQTCGGPCRSPGSSRSIATEASPRE